jgi:hypothetical protein
MILRATTFLSVNRAANPLYFQRGRREAWKFHLAIARVTAWWLAGAFSVLVIRVETDVLAKRKLAAHEY